MAIVGKLDPRFSEATEPTAWAEVDALLGAAELYWLATMRRNGRPHVTPLIGAWIDATFVFCAGPDEQKARNLAHSASVTVTTGVNTWKDGIDVMVDGDAQRVVGVAALRPLADAIREKYDGEWDFTPHEDGFGQGNGGAEHIAHVFRVTPTKVLAFAKAPHGQTAFRF
jgi:hypothetical protein